MPLLLLPVSEGLVFLFPTVFQCLCQGANWSGEVRWHLLSLLGVTVVQQGSNLVAAEVGWCMWGPDQVLWAGRGEVSGSAAAPKIDAAALWPNRLMLRWGRGASRLPSAGLPDPVLAFAEVAVLQ